MAILDPESPAATQNFLDGLGVDWYLDFKQDMSQVPAGANKVPYLWISTNPTVWTSLDTEPIDTLTEEQIAALGFANPADVWQTSASAPGSYWYMFGEPNRYTGMTGARFAPVFRYYRDLIIDADPTAKIVGPAILNWDWTCFVYCDYTTGEAWLKDFIDTYEALYGVRPSVDAWAIDTYPIDWFHTPNNDPDPSNQPSWKGQKALHSAIVIDQLQGMRQYLNGQGYADTPIWITELAIHVGYDGWRWEHKVTGANCTSQEVLAGECRLTPTGDYHWDKMSDYLAQVLDWLEDLDGGSANKIEKWFFFTPWKDIENVGGDGYMGIIYFNGPDENASLNCLGKLYRSRALQDSADPPQKKKCDASGNTIDDPG